jgi:Reverse transcriptase (RNA-dependent DNA polymerase)
MEPILDSCDDPSWAEALTSPDREYWIAGGCDELNSLKDLNVFVLVPCSEVPHGQRPLKGKLVCKWKCDDAGNIVRYKVRYVAKGYAQRYGVDYDKTTAPTVRLESFRTILHIAATLGWDLQHVDVKTAFLHGVLPESETMFMEQPPGFEAPGKEDWVMKLMKSLYGMKQASRVWNQTFDKVVKELGFERLACEWCVYRRESPTGTIIFAVHVDDIVSAASSPAENDLFKSQLKQHWDISDLGPAKFALGIAIARDIDAKTVAISQSALIDRVVEQFGQSEAHSVDTPMVAGLQLRRPDRTLPTPSHIIEWAERTPYRSLVGSLMYIARGTRPDIAHAVSRLASYLDCYRPEHWNAAVRVVRYLKGTRDLRLVLGGQGPLRLVGYSDSDYANCPDSSRSVSGHCFSLGSAMISWSSRKQRIVADSSCYAKYIALHDSAREMTFLRQLLDGLHLLPSDATPIHCDNNAASILSEDHVFHARVKHIRVKYHAIREMVDNGEVVVARIRSSDNTADILTKALGRPDFLRLRHGLGLRGHGTQEEPRSL